jgi:hypothetical protein
MAVDYLEAIALSPDNERLVSTRLLDIANQPGEIPPAHPVGTAGMSSELVDRNTCYLILDSRFSCFSH